MNKNPVIENLYTAYLQVLKTKDGDMEEALKQVFMDMMTLAFRLYGEDENTFSPETAAVMDELRPLVEAALKGDWD